MLSDLFFVVRVLIITFVIAILMQVKLGEQTIEDHSYIWIKESAVGQTLQKVADAGVIALQRGLKGVSQFFSEQFRRDIAADPAEVPGYRELKFKVNRSKQYLEEQGKKIVKHIGDEQPEEIIEKQSINSIDTESSERE